MPKAVSPVFWRLLFCQACYRDVWRYSLSSRSQQLMLPRLPLEPLRISAKRRSGHRANSPMARPKRVTDLTEPTKEFTSSTSPKSWFTGDGLLKPQHKVMAFTVLNYDNLKENIARGQGEYLASLASLVNVPQEGQAEFFIFAQGLYPMVYGEGVPPVDSVNRLIAELPKKP